MSDPDATAGGMLLPFPEPPATIQHTLNCLAVMRGGDKEAIKNLGDTEDLPRPWEPDGCDDELRRGLWGWLDDVVAWLNHEYAWRPQNLVPACWPRHPHIVRELAVLACLRAGAAHALSPEPVEDWHRYALPSFIERMTGRLGEGGCRNGKHDAWPSASRYNDYIHPDATRERRQGYDHDAPTRRLRPIDGGR